MTSTVIKPTVGRRVWFRPSAAFLASNPTLTQFNPEQPMDAGIVYVHHDHMVNLIVTDHVGKTLAVTSVPLLAGQYVADEDAGVYCCCEWMPYQKSQAAKEESATRMEAAKKGLETSSEALYRAWSAMPIISAPTHRDELERVLVSGASTHVAHEPGRAADIAKGIKTVLDALTPTATSTLPVVDSGPESLEREIQAKANKGPRVTPAALQAEIVSEHYFTAGEGVMGAFVAAQHAQGNFEFQCPMSDDLKSPLNLLTFCVLVLRNGFTVIGHSACASPENYNKEIGERIARENAERQIRPLLGFRLRDELARPVLTDADAAADLAGTPRPDNPTAEAADFLVSVKACDLSGDAPCEACQ